MRQSKARRRLGCERLEHRIVLDASGSGVAVELPVEDTGVYQQFGSEEAFSEWFVEAAVERWEHFFGETVYRWADPYLTDEWSVSAAPRALVPMAADADYSTTNNQVAGVDEGDLVKTDGDFLYILRDRDVTIVDATDLEVLNIASRIELDGQAITQYLDGDRLTVLSSAPSYDYWYADLWQPYPAPSNVTVSVFDISDRTEPTLIERMEVDGRNSQSRVVGDFLYLVTNSTIDYPVPRSECAEFSKAVDVEHAECRFESQEEYIEWLTSEFDATSVLPTVTSESADGETSTTPLAFAGQVYRPVDMSGNFVSIISIDVAAEDPAAVSSAVFSEAYSSTVYVSATSMYLARYTWHAESPSTLVQKIALSDDGQIEPVAAGNVPGHLLNQYSMDEFDGLLRVGTTIRSREATSGVYVLEQDGDQLAVKGSVEGLAPAEQIFAARFIGEEAYLVTFRLIDPLIAIDLSDPTDPQVTGELKITGFSNFLQPIDEDLLVGIGRDVDPEQPRARGAAQLSLFDVSDPEEPELADRYSFDGPWSHVSGEAHAIGWYPEYQLFAIPSSGETDHYPMDQLSVFQIDVAERTIDYITSISHPSSVLRSLRISDKLVSVSHDYVMLHEMSDPATEVDRLALHEVGHDDAFTVAQGSTEHPLNVLRNDFPRRRPITILPTRPPIIRPVFLDDGVAGEPMILVTDDGEFVDEKPQPPWATITSVSDAKHGTVVISEDGTELLYTPDESFVGLDSFTYTMESADGLTGDATVTTTVYPVVQEDSQDNVIDVLAMVGLSPADATILSVGDPHYGQLEFELGMEHVLFTPDASYHGRVDFSFTYAINGEDDELHGRVRVDVENVLDPPDALDDRYSVPSGTERLLPVLTNDFSEEINGLRIVELGPTSAGGTVEFVSDASERGSRVRYRPAEDFVGIETFTYTVMDEAGQTDTATVHVEVFEPEGDPHPSPSEPMVTYHVELTDEEGTPIEQAQVGQSILVNVYVEDQRYAGTGVFAGFVDVTFDPERVAVGDWQFGEAFPNAQSGKLGSGVIDELGAAAGFTETGRGPSLLASIPMVAEQTGRLAVELDPADLMPMSETLVYGISEGIDDSRIVYRSSVIEIVEAGWQNSAEAKDVNNDGDVTPMDALVVINELNGEGSRPLDGIPQIDPRPLDTTGAEAERSTAMVRAFIDVNGDRHLSSLDALVIINYLNAKLEAVAASEGEAALVGVFTEFGASGAEFGQTDEPLDGAISQDQITIEWFVGQDDDASSDRAREAPEPSELAGDDLESVLDDLLGE